MRLETTWITLARKNDEFAVRHCLSRRRKMNHGMALGSADLDCTAYADGARDRARHRQHRTDCFHGRIPRPMGMGEAAKAPLRRKGKTRIS
jgi:hypothetical protein